MANYKNRDGRLELIKENPFKLEKEIQTLTEKNLKLIFGLDFVKSEFSLNNFHNFILDFINCISYVKLLA